jgi:hypothetical protein
VEPQLLDTITRFVRVEAHAGELLDCERPSHRLLDIVSLGQPSESRLLGRTEWRQCSAHVRWVIMNIYEQQVWHGIETIAHWDAIIGGSSSAA